MKKRIIQAVLISVFTTIGFAKFASAANVPVNTSDKLHICYNYSNVYQSYQFGAWGISQILPTGSSSYMSASGAPSVSNTGITYVSGTHTYSNCYDYYLNNQSQSGTEMYFTSIAPREVVIDFKDAANSHSSDGFTNSETHYYATVAVRNTVDSNKVITGQEAVLLFVKDEDGNKVNQLDFNYTANAVPVDLTLEKTVKGDMGDATKYFKFSVNIAGTTGTTYTVNGTTGTGSASSCTANTACTIYLKHGDSVRIGYNGTSSEIPAGTTYSVTESENTGYSTTYAIAGGAESIGSTTGTQTLSTTAADNVVEFINTKDGSPVTGIFTNVLPYIVIAGLSVAGIFIAKKHKVKGVAQ